MTKPAKKFFEPLAIGAPQPYREVPVKSGTDDSLLPAAYGKNARQSSGYGQKSGCYPR